MNSKMNNEEIEKRVKQILDDFYELSTAQYQDLAIQFVSLIEMIVAEQRGRSAVVGFHTAVKHSGSVTANAVQKAILED